MFCLLKMNEINVEGSRIIFNQSFICEFIIYLSNFFIREVIIIQQICNLTATRVKKKDEINADITSQC